MGNHNTTVKFLRNQPHQLLESENIGSHSIDDLIIVVLPGIDHDIGHILHVKWLQSILTRAEDGKYWEAVQEPGNIIDQNILVTKDNGRTNDGIGQCGGENS